MTELTVWGLPVVLDESLRPNEFRIRERARRENPELRRRSRAGIDGLGRIARGHAVDQVVNRRG